MGRTQLIAHGYVMRDPTDAELRDDPDAAPVVVPPHRFGDIREQLARTLSEDERSNISKR